MTPLMQLWWRLVERSGLRPGFATEFIEDLPHELAPRRLYLIGEPTLPWSAALLCPCGCGATMQLSLVPGDMPSWRARCHFSGSVTLHPSIWRIRDCRSHFHLRRGRVVWARSLFAAVPSPVSDAINKGNLPMANHDYPDRIDRLAAGSLSQLSDYLSNDIETPDDLAMLEDRAVGTSAKLMYLNAIQKRLWLIESGKEQPAEALAHLDALASAWMAKGTAARDPSQKGATMAHALAGRWKNWAVGGPMAKERQGFVNHFDLPD